MPDTLEFLGELLDGKALTPDRLDELVKRQVEEDQWLDYKSGDLLKDKYRNFKLRKHVSGFANAQGGVLLVGVVGKEKDSQGRSWTVTGCDEESLNETTLVEWARDALRDIAVYLVPFPLLSVVTHAQGAVLAIAIQRAPRLVPCRERHGIVHYLRIGHGTERIPEYLYTDLVLGRRQHPTLALTGSVKIIPQNWPNVLFQWEIAVENEGLIWAKQIRAGIIGYMGLGHHKLSSSIKNNINVIKNSDDEPVLHSFLFEDVSGASLHHAEPGFPSRQNVIDLGPFDRGEVVFNATASLPPNKNHRYPYRLRCLWKGTLYVVTSTSDIIWAQMSVAFSWEVNEFRGKRPSISMQEQSLTVVGYERPTVSWKCEEY